MPKTKHASNDVLTRGSGNVYEDLGFRNAGEMLARAQLVDAIRAIVKNRALTQTRAAGLVGIPQPKMSELLRGNTKGFSCDRLMRILTLLGQDVKITITPAKSRARGVIHVAA